MAKIGNHVSQGWLPFDPKEVRAIEVHLKKQCEQVFGVSYFSRYETVVDNAPLSFNGTRYYANIRSMKVYAYVALPIPEYKGRERGRVVDHTRVEFTIHKDGSGWLDVKDPAKPYEYTGKRDYKNAPLFSYSGSVRADGRQVCGHRREIMEPKSHYQYGTEVIDLDFIEALRDLRSMTNVYGIPRKYMPIWKKREELRKAA